MSEKQFIITVKKAEEGKSAGEILGGLIIVVIVCSILASVIK